MADLTPDQIAAESAQRPRVAQYAFAAGFASLVGGIGALVFTRSLPSSSPETVVDLFETLNDRLVTNQQPPQSLNARQIEHLGDHLIGFAGPQVLTSLGLLLLLAPLLFVFQATRARKADLRPLGGVMLVVGAVASALGTAGYAIAVGIDAGSFSGLSAASARDVLTGQIPVVFQVIGLIGRFALTLGLIVVSLNAMRTGLFTRFVGWLGIIVGITVILPVGTLDQINLLRSSWLVFVGLLLLGRMPGAYRDPPAWARGEAIPWPTQQELRERREAEQALQSEGDTPADAAPKRSRKRRK